MNPKEKARAYAEETVRAMGWPETPMGHLFDDELLHSCHEEFGVKISVWDAGEDVRPDAPLTCEIMDEEKALHVLGVPVPEEVSDLLERYADITESLHDGPRRYRVDLETGKVLLSETEVERFPKTPPEKMDVETTTTVEGQVAAFGRFSSYLKGTLPILDASEWKTEGVYVGLAEVDDRIIAHHQNGDGRDTLQLTLSITRAGAWYGITRPGEDEKEEVGDGLAPGVRVPTPQEARELYFGGAA